MSSFDCLDPNTPLYSHTLLEASAGTGKTFATSHLVTRFVLDGVDIEKILVVTFTVAATKELKERIARCLEAALATVQKREKGAFAYLDAVIEQGESACFTASLRLERALLRIDSAHICTIHSFCFKCLDEQGLIAANLNGVEHTDYKGFYLEKIKASFRGGSFHELIATGSLTRLLRSYRFSYDKLYTALIDHLASDADSSPSFSFSEIKSTLREELSKVDREALLRALPLFKGFYTVSKDLKPSFEKQLKACVGALTDEKLDTLIVEKLGLFTLLEETNIKKSGAKLVDESVRELMRRASKISEPLEKLRDVRYSFLHLAALCRAELEKDPETKLHLSPDNLVHNMQKALEEKAFLEKTSSLFDVAIIDEFQDTDQAQWSIFSSLFLKRRAKAFYLVGDPKQSIYSFRKADISIFYQAKASMDHVAHLDTNYRSSSCLQTLLNRLFSLSPSWLNMPGQTLEYKPVKFAPSAEKSLIQDGKQAVHFALYKDSSKGKKSWPSSLFEKEVLFPFIASEALLLHEKEGIPFSKMAVLVKDRFSKNRLASYLAKCGIPYKVARSGSLFDTASFDFFSSLILAVIEKGGQGHLEAVMTHPFNVPFNAEKLKQHFVYVHKVWERKGFAAAIAALLTRVVDESSIENALKRSASEQVTSQLYAIVNQFYVGFAHEVRLMKTMKHFLLHESHHFLTLEKVMRAPSQGEGIEIMTTFMSKGLEFDVVFPIALLYRHGAKTEFVREKGALVPFDKGNKAHIEILEKAQAERQRQLYVAMTRAKKRLYLPFVMDEYLEHVPLNTRSSLEAFLPSEQLIKVIDDIGASYHFISRSEQQPLYKPPKKITPHKERACYDFSSQVKPRFIESFSSLTQDIGGHFTSSEPVEVSLPAGKKTGVILHSVLEKMIETGLYQKSDSNEAKALIKAQLGSEYEEHIPIVEQMTHTVFTQAILPVPLSKISQQDLKAELSFTFREKGLSMTGFIDLVVIYKSEVFVIDWKSNVLASYDDKHLKEAICEHQYDLQARIYKTALLQSLRLRSLKLTFGGAIYIFLRGLEKQQGIIWLERKSKA